MRKYDCNLYATILSQAKLGQPKLSPQRNRHSGKMEYVNKLTYDQESTVEIEFPTWPVKQSYIDKALENMRQQVAITIMKHLEAARKYIFVEVFIEPVINKKLDKHYMETEIDKKHGFAIYKPVEYKNYDLQPYFFRMTIPYLGNNLDSEVKIHETFDKVAPHIKQTLIKAGITD